MKNGFRIVDAEPHIMEPPDLWDHHLEEPYRSATRTIRRSQGEVAGRGVRFQLGDEATSPSATSDSALVDRHIRERVPAQPNLLAASSTHDPEVFLEGMDIEGIDVGVFMPTSAMFAVRCRDGIDPQHALAICRVYNDYACSFTRHDAERLKFWAWVPPQDAELAAEEARRCVEELGAAGVAITKGAVDGHLFCDEFFEPLWQELDRLKVSLGLHGITSSDRIRDNIQYRYDNHPRAELVANAIRGPFYAHTAAAELIFGGVLERYPNVRPLFMETGASWIPWLLCRMDEKWGTYQSVANYKLPMKPSEYFQRQCFAVMEPDEDAAKYVIDYIGDRNVVLSTDYPHHDSLFPESINTFLALEGIGEESKRRILWDNAAMLFNWKGA